MKCQETVKVRITPPAQTLMFSDEARKWLLEGFPHIDEEEFLFLLREYGIWKHCFNWGVSKNASYGLKLPDCFQTKYGLHYEWIFFPKTIEVYCYNKKEEDVVKMYVAVLEFSGPSKNVYIGDDYAAAKKALEKELEECHWARKAKIEVWKNNQHDYSVELDISRICGLELSEIFETHVAGKTFRLTHPEQIDCAVKYLETTKERMLELGIGN